jgi:hypothetical protein
VVTLTTFLVIVAQTHREFAFQAEPCTHSLLGLKIWQMPAEKFDGIIILAEMDQALKYKPVN